MLIITYTPLEAVCLAGLLAGLGALGWAMFVCVEIARATRRARAQEASRTPVCASAPHAMLA